MDDFAHNDAETKRHVIDRLDVPATIQRIRVCVGDKFVRAAINEDPKLPLKITDVLVGPLNFRQTAVK